MSNPKEQTSCRSVIRDFLFDSLSSPMASFSTLPAEILALARKAARYGVLANQETLVHSLQIYINYLFVVIAEQVFLDHLYFSMIYLNE